MQGQEDTTARNTHVSVSAVSLGPSVRQDPTQRLQGLGTAFGWGSRRGLSASSTPGRGQGEGARGSYKPAEPGQAQRGVSSDHPNGPTTPARGEPPGSLQTPRASCLGGGGAGRGGAGRAEAVGSGPWKGKWPTSRFPGRIHR